MTPALQVNAFVLGFASAGSALLSLGSQNVFILKRGLSRQHLMVTVAICFGSDGLLMSLAVLGFASVLNTIPVAAFALRLAGCLYLAVGSIRMLMRPAAVRSATKPRSRHCTLGRLSSAQRW